MTYKLTSLLPAATSFAMALSMTALSVPFTAAPGYADEIQSSITRGGRIYDNWYSETHQEAPGETHSAWPASNTKKSGAATTRCKACHGWDLAGADGAYGSGSYKTGIKGLKNMAGVDNSVVIAAVTDDLHGFAGKLSEEDLTDLANFVTKGQYDAATYISYETKVATGDVALGEEVFNTVCALCHTKDGTKVDGKPMGEPIGLLASGNPWEAMSKILNGQPSEDMPALRAFGLDAAAGILAYAQTLPHE